MSSGDITITVVGNLTADPELRFTARGDAVASFTLAASSRYLDKATNEWKDGDAVFMRCNLWRKYAENFVESVKRGQRVIATGKLKQRSYETKEGEKRTVMELEVDEVGPALRYSIARLEKVTTGAPASGGAPAPGPDAPPAGGGYGGGYNPEAPF